MSLLKIVYGRAGTGKSTYCLEQVAKEINLKEKSYIITPEQFSYSAEKNLLKYLKTSSVINAEVISFHRMAERLETEVGGATKKLLSKTGKAMLAYSILKKYKKELKFLGQSDENIDVMLREITEFKKHNIKANEINSIVEQINNDKLKYKLTDFEKIYLAYENWLKDKFIDEEDVLTRLSLNLENSIMFNNTNIYIDEFAGFTTQEYEIIKKLMKKANKLTITICTDSINIDKLPEEDIFFENKKVIQKIIEYAKQENIKTDKPVELNYCYRLKNKELLHLEKNLFSNTLVKFEPEVNNIRAFLTTNPYTELEYIAKQIIKLVKYNNYRYKDIEVITSNVEEISSMVKAIFNKFNIPVFFDEKKELTQNILIKYILCILEIFAQNWSKTAVFNYLKLGFTDIDVNTIYLLENYCNKKGIQSSKWFKDEYWSEDKELSDIKNIFIEPLINLKKELEEEKTCKEFTTKLYKFIENQQIMNKMQKKVDLFKQNSNLLLANEYARAFQVLINVLDEIVLLFENEKMTFSKYTELLKVAFKNEEIGNIPQAIDQVIFGDINRSKSHEIKATFIMGMNDGKIPAVSKDEGFFDDNDREKLKSIGKEIAKGGIENLYEEQFNIYKAFTIAEEKIFLSYASSNNDGGALRASILINKIKKIFPKLKEESDILYQKAEITNESGTFEELLIKIRNSKNGEQLDEFWSQVLNWYNNNDFWRIKLKKALAGLRDTNKAEIISQDNMIALYGNTLKTSVSKLEQYEKCPFSYHLTYGLKLKEQEEFKIKSLDTGSFMHDVIATFFMQEPNIKEITKEEIQEIVKNIIDDKLKLNRNFIFNSSPKFIALTNILKDTISEDIRYIVEQMKNSDFEVLGNEVEFSKQVDNIEITGKIDRIDIGKNEQGEYIRIIDYKSSASEDIDLNETLAGVRIQLLTYMDIFSIKQNKIPAGMLYFNLIHPIIQENQKLSDEQIEQKIKEKFRMKGLILADVKVIKMMDKELEIGKSTSLPITLDVNGNISKTSKVISSEDFSNLQKKVRQLIFKICKEITKGNIDIKPLYSRSKKKSACQYCQYSLICGFDKTKDEFRFVENKTKEEILSEIRQDSD